MTKARMSKEYAIQRALVAWLGEEYPHVMVQASMNENSRSMMAMGLTAGYPDLTLFWSERGECGSIIKVMFLELKTKTGRLSNEQLDWHTRWNDTLRGFNSFYAVAYGFSEAKEAVSRIIAKV